jgi:hypothetical protein
VDEGDEGDEGDAGDEGDEGGARRRGPALVHPGPETGYGWMWSKRDKALFRKMREKCATWDCKSFRFDEDIASHANGLKIHDWMVMSGSIMAYFIHQCDGLDDNYKLLFIDFFFAMESMCHKVYARDGLDEVQRRIDLVLADCEYMLPAFFAGRIVRSQPHYFALQVKRLGPFKAHAMVEVETYNQFLKKWAKSRKNLGEGIARLNRYVQEAWLGRLTLDDLRPPPVYSKVHVHEFLGGGKPRCINSKSYFVELVGKVNAHQLQRPDLRLKLVCLFF